MARRGGMAYDYSLGLAQEKEKEREQAFKESQAQQTNQAKEFHENLRDSLAQQGERLRAAIALDSHVRDMGKMQDQEQAALDTAKFRAVYRLLKNDDPNRNAQISELFQAYPGAAKNSEVQKDIATDDKEIAKGSKAGLTKEDQQFLKDHGPSAFGGKDKTYQALQDAAGNTGAANHEDAAIAYGHVHDLMKKSVGIPSGTPEGISRGDYIKNIESTFQKIPGTNTPNPSYQPPAGQAPPPSTPAPQNAEAWSNTSAPDVARLPAAQQQPAAPAPTAAPAAPTSQGAKDFLNQVKDRFQKTSDAGAAAAASSNRDELNTMLNQSPETQFAAPKPQPTPTPTPAPNKDQYYTA